MCEMLIERRPRGRSLRKQLSSSSQNRGGNGNLMITDRASLGMSAQA